MPQEHTHEPIDIVDRISPDKFSDRIRAGALVMSGMFVPSMVYYKDINPVLALTKLALDTLHKF